jgi:hypothetical protein
MSARKAWVVVTHWVHPEVADYLAGSCDAVSRQETRESGLG